MSWLTPDREILPRPSTNTSPQLCDAVMVVVSRKLGRKYHTNRDLNPRPVVCESITLSAHPQLLPYSVRMCHPWVVKWACLLLIPQWSKKFTYKQVVVVFGLAFSFYNHKHNKSAQSLYNVRVWHSIVATLEIGHWGPCYKWVL